MRAFSATMMALFCIGTVSTGAIAPAWAVETSAESAVASAGKFEGHPPAAQIGIPYAHKFNYSGRAVSILANGLPAGLTMDKTGQVTGTPTLQRVGAHRIKLAVFDLDAQRLVETFFTLQLDAPPVSVPDVQLSSGSTDINVPPNTAFELELTPDGPGTHLTVSDLPDWLSYDPATQRIAGVSPAVQETQRFTVTATNYYDAINKVVTLSFAQRSGDTYTEVLLDRHISGWTTIEWVARCPADFPWLDKNVGTAGRQVGQGIRVAEENFGVEVHAYSDGLIEEFDNVWWVQGATGYIRNWNATTRAFTIEMVCTKNPDSAWTYRSK